MEFQPKCRTCGGTNLKPGRSSGWVTCIDCTQMLHEARAVLRAGGVSALIKWGNDRATGNASGNTTDDRNGVTSDTHQPTSGQ